MSETPRIVEDLAAAEAARTVEVLQLEAGVAEKALHGEDRALADEENRLYGAIDGMGGYHGGSIAAQEVHDAAQEFMTAHRGEFTPDNGADMMRDLFRAAISRVEARAAIDPSISSMGAVAAIGHFFEHEGKSYVATGVVGDAKFMIKNEGEERGYMSKEECLPPPNANVVTNAIQPGHTTELNQFEVRELKDGDRAAFLTDGITGDDPEDRLKPGEARHALELPSAQESADDFLRVSLPRKMDDKTAVVVRATVRSTEADKPKPETARRPSPLDVPAAVAERRRKAAAKSAETHVAADEDDDITAIKLEPVPAPAETHDGAAKAAAELGFSSADALIAHFDDIRAAVADESHPRHRLAVLELERRGKDRPPIFMDAYEAYVSGSAHESVVSADDASASHEEAPDRAGETSAETIARLTAENEGLNRRITDLETNITSLQAEVATLTREITALREALATAGVVDPTRVRGPEPVPAPDDPEERRRRGDRERYDAAVADPDAVDIFESVRAQEVYRVQVLIDKWVAEGHVLDADKIAAMRADMLKGAFDAAAAASVAAGNARRDAHSPTRDRTILERERRIAELEHELADIRSRRRRDRRYEDDDHHDDDAGTPTPTPEDRRRAAVERYMSPELPELDDDEELDLSEPGLLARIRSRFSRDRAEDEADDDADPETERERRRDRAVRRYLVPMATAAAIYAGTLRPGERPPVRR